MTEKNDYMNTIYMRTMEFFEVLDTPEGKAWKEERDRAKKADKQEFLHRRGKYKDVPCGGHGDPIYEVPLGNNDSDL